MKQHKCASRYLTITDCLGKCIFLWHFAVEALLSCGLWFVVLGFVFGNRATSDGFLPRFGSGAVGHHGRSGVAQKGPEITPGNARSSSNNTQLMLCSLQKCDWRRCQLRHFFLIFFHLIIFFFFYLTVFFYMGGRTKEWEGDLRVLVGSARDFEDAFPLAERARPTGGLSIDGALYEVRIGSLRMAHVPIRSLLDRIVSPLHRYEVLCSYFLVPCDWGRWLHCAAVQPEFMWFDSWWPRILRP